MATMVANSLALQALLRQNEIQANNYAQLTERILQNTAQYGIPVITDRRPNTPYTVALPEQGCPEDSLNIRAAVLKTTGHVETVIETFSLYCTTWKRTMAQHIGYQDQVITGFVDALTEFDQMIESFDLTDEQKSDIKIPELREALDTIHKDVVEFFNALEKELAVHSSIGNKQTRQPA